MPKVNTAKSGPIPLPPQENLSQERSDFRPKKVDSLSLGRENFPGARKGYSLGRFLNFGTPLYVEPGNKSTEVGETSGRM